jgi:hypothetical protein
MQLIFGNLQIINFIEISFGFKDTKIQMINLRAKTH